MPFYTQEEMDEVREIILDVINIIEEEKGEYLTCGDEDVPYMLKELIKEIKSGN